MAGRNTTFALVSRLRLELDRLSEEAVGFGASGLDAHGWEPRVDVIEQESHVDVLIELPGVELSDLTLEARGPELRIRGHKPGTPNPSCAKFHRIERGRGRFERQISLTVPVNTHRAQASLERGVLTISLPKIDQRRQQTRAIRIREHDDG